MANLPESATWDVGVYQIETTDPVQGGLEGIANAQARALANRSAYLKARADEVDDARGTFGTLAERLERQAGAVVTGEVTLLNRGVIKGFVLSKSDIRALHLSQTGAVGGGTNLARVRGITITLPDDDYHVTVPMNASLEEVTWYAYLTLASSSWRVILGATIPTDALLLYRVVVPAEDMEPDLEAVTLIDNRNVISQPGWFQSVAPTTVELDPPPGHTNYGVLFEVVSAAPLGREGRIEVAERHPDHFTVTATGTADQVTVRWTVTNP